MKRDGDTFLCLFAYLSNPSRIKRHRDNFFCWVSFFLFLHTWHPIKRDGDNLQAPRTSLGHVNSDSGPSVNEHPVQESYMSKPCSPLIVKVKKFISAVLGWRYFVHASQDSDRKWTTVLIFSAYFLAHSSQPSYITQLLNYDDYGPHSPFVREISSKIRYIAEAYLREIGVYWYLSLCLVLLAILCHRWFHLPAGMSNNSRLVLNVSSLTDPHVPPTNTSCSTFHPRCSPIALSPSLSHTHMAHTVRSNGSWLERTGRG